MARDEDIKVEILHITLLQIHGIDLDGALQVETEYLGRNIVQAMLQGHVPSIAQNDSSDSEAIWTAYGRFRRDEFPNLER